MSPLLIILFLNDLAKELNVNNNYFENNDIIDQFQKFVLLFADEALLLAESHSELQILLNKLYIYCKKWNLTVNQGWDKYYPAGKFQWEMPDNAGMANTPKITEVVNTGTYEQN